MTRFTKRLLLGAAVTLGLAAPAIGFTSLAAADEVAMPKTMIWSTYDLGSSGYVEASAIADAMIKKYGTQVRILPSGTSVGRLLPLKGGKAQFGWLANEVYFASEALFDFANPTWGPQDLRILMGRPAYFGIAVAENGGIKTPADLRGKRVAQVKANPSINVKTEAMMAFAGLTWDDVDVVEMPSYGAALRALVDGQIDAVGTVPTAATMFEMESSDAGLAWIDAAPDNKAGWDALTKVAPFFAPGVATAGAGITGKHPYNLMSYRYPMLTVYADADDDLVYAMIKAMDETYGVYKNSGPSMANWRLSESGVTPADAPFHPGAIRYLKEKGIWTDKDQAWNDQRIKRGEAVRQAWTEARNAAETEKVSDKDWPAFWDAWRKDHLI
jgi:TRAP transporter TAXI family solute receptor